ncbi:MAG: ABC transporter permease subunit [Sedimentitalea sp.]
MMSLASRLKQSAWQARLWLAVFAFTALLIWQRANFPNIVEFPDAWTVPLASWLNVVMDLVVEYGRTFTRAISGALASVLSASQAIFVQAPWSVTVAFFALIAWQGGGRRVCLITVFALFYILISGYWAPAMNTLSLVVVALPLSVLIGFGTGYLAVRSARMKRAILPTLDLMQTIPAFAYLIPILLLFGFGPVVGLIASVIFAVPPMVRNTIVGFEQIPPAILESGSMSGCSNFQRFRWVELPTALPQMLIGVNQTTMAALSMVIIAAIIGGFEDIGWEVLSGMRKAQFGQSLLSGIVIVLLAILLDRMTAAYAARQLPTASHPGLSLRTFSLSLGAVIIGAYVAAYIIPSLRVWPEQIVFFPAQAINDAIERFIISYGDAMEALRNAVLYFVLLPTKIGLERAVAPFTWGMTFTTGMKITYWLFVASGCATAFAFGKWRFGVTLVVIMGLVFFGTTGLPWATASLLVVLIAHQAGGKKPALLAAFTVLFLLLNGLWLPAMLSVYLCLVAVFLCILLGGLIGIWAASSDLVSGIIRPINDMLQTLPQFVLLIPALMLFQVGDFTALLAIIAYAIVPMIRYVEYGLRSVPPTLLDAGISCGLTKAQLFWQVKLPAALPQILIGINQTVLYGLGMLVIAALVGTTGLGQAIYVALGKADAGAGIVAGLGMALIAMTADRIIQSVIGSRM